MTHPAIPRASMGNQAQQIGLPTTSEGGNGEDGEMRTKWMLTLCEAGGMPGNLFRQLVQQLIEVPLPFTSWNTHQIQENDKKLSIHLITWQGPRQGHHTFGCICWAVASPCVLQKSKAMCYAFLQAHRAARNISDNAFAVSRDARGEVDGRPRGQKQKNRDGQAPPKLRKPKKAAERADKRVSGARRPKRRTARRGGHGKDLPDTPDFGLSKGFGSQVCGIRVLSVFCTLFYDVNGRQ